MDRNFGHSGNVICTSVCDPDRYVFEEVERYVVGCNLCVINRKFLTVSLKVLLLSKFLDELPIKIFIIVYCFGTRNPEP